MSSSCQLGRRIFAVVRTLILAQTCLLALAASAVEPRPSNRPEQIRRDAADPFFESGAIPSIQIEISRAGMDHLRNNPRNYVKATVREGGLVLTNVSIHVKGAAGSTRSIDDRPALTVNIDKLSPGQHFHGLSKLHLNNSVQDPSYMTELLCSELFLAAGVPAARTTYAVVELNGRPLGLYVLKEGFGKQFLKRHFKVATGNLYDGGFLKDISDSMQKISGDEGEGQPAAEKLVKACEVPDPGLRMSAIAQRLALDRFLSFISLEMMIWHWDGYLMKRNNYRVYHDPETDRIVFFPHGMDQMFWSPNGTVRPPAEGLVAEAVLNTPLGATLFKDRSAWIATNLFLASTLTNRIASIYKRIHPVLESIDLEQAREHEAAVRSLTRQVAQRAAFLDRKFGAHPAKPLVFDARGEMKVGGWKSRLDAGEAQFRETTLEGVRTAGIEVLTLPPKTDPEGLESCLASYRTALELPPGRYALVGRVRTEGVEVAGKSVRGSGAGLRVSQRRRENALAGDTPWKELVHEFVIENPDEETELICDLRAKKGRAFFDLDSMRLRKLPLEKEAANP